MRQLTVLPIYENAVRIIIESEDHKTTNTFVVNLDADATDDSKDYDKSKDYFNGWKRTIRK